MTISEDADPISVNMSHTVVAGFVSSLMATQNPRPVFTDARLSEFVGREWLIEQVDRFLTEQPCGFVFIQADPGLGKTALAAHLVQERKYPSHFTHLGGRSESAAVRNLSAQLFNDFDLVYLAPPGTTWKSSCMVPEWAHTSEGFALILSYLEEELSDYRKKLVLVVDGLDEAEPTEDGLPLGLPTRLPERVYVIATCRPGVAVSVDSPSLWLSITTDHSENTADIHQFLTRTVQEPVLAERLTEAGVPAEEFITTLTQRCGGVWLYLRYLLDEIRLGHRSVTDLDNLPNTLTDYYTQVLHIAQHDQQWEQVALPVLTTLTAAQEPLTVEAITRLSGASDLQAVRQLCEHQYRQFLTVTDTRRYRIYHATLRDYLTNRFPDAVRNAHSRIADHYLTSFGGLQNHLSTLATDPGLAGQDDGYPLRHLVTHLEHAGRIDDLHTLLTREYASSTGRIHNVWYQAHDHAGTANTYLANIIRAQELARADTDRYLATGQATPHLGLELLYTLMASSVSRLLVAAPDSPIHDSTLIELIPHLVKTGLWPTQRALTHTFHIVNDDYRVQALAGLVPHLPPDLLPQIIKAVTALPSESARLEALTQLIPQLSPDLRPHLIHAATTLTYPASRAKIWTRLAPYLPSDLLSQAFEDATAVTDERDCFSALTALAPHLPLDQRRRAFQHALQIAIHLSNGNYSGHDSWKLIDLADLFYPDHPDLLQQLLQAAAALSRNDDRANVLAHLIQYLPPEQRPAISQQALQAAHAIYNEERKAWILGRIAQHLPSEQSQAVFQQALQAALNDRSPYLRIGTLVILARLLPPDQRHTAFQHALDVTAVIISDIAERAERLSYLAPHLPAGLLQQALQIATAIPSNYYRAWALIRIVQHLPPEQRPAVLQQALQAATAITNRADRASILGQLAPHLPPDQRSTVFQQALQSAIAITNDYRRACALTKLAPKLPPDQRRIAHQHAFQATTALSGHFLFCSVLTSLVPQLPLDQRRRLLEYALDVLTVIPDDVVRAWTLTSLAEHLPPDERPHALQQALDDTAIPDDFDHAETASRLVKHLPLYERYNGLESDPEYIYDLDIAIKLVERAPHLPPDQLPQALQTAATIPVVPDRAYVFRHLLVRVPPEELATRIQQAARSTSFGSEGIKLFTHCMEALPHDLRGLVTIMRALTANASRAAVLTLLAMATPLIQRHGGPPAIRYCLDAIRTVCRWWPATRIK